jgi:hypothetical protein
MAFDNSPTAGSMPYRETDRRRTNWIPLLSTGLIIALMGTLGYTIWDNSKIKDSLQEKDAEYAMMMVQKDTLQSLLDDASMRYDLLKTINVKRDSTISSQEREITKIRSLIQSLLAIVHISQTEHSELRQLIASLNNNIEGYKQQIVTATEQNNQQLAAQLALANEEKIKAEKPAETVQPPVEEKAVEAGSTFYATNFVNKGLVESRNGKTKKTKAARKVDMMHVSFDLEENHSTTSGPKELYVTITSPDGSPLMIQAYGSGKFTTKDGKEKAFTKKIDVNYIQGQDQKISFDWKQESKFENGQYKIEVFNNAYKIGEGVCSFKKSGVFD